MAGKAVRPKRKGGHEEHEEHVNHERWLVSYADMITLLFVLFVVLYALSNVDKAKFEALAASLSEGFGSQSVTFSGKAAPMEGAGSDPNIALIEPGAAPDLGEAAGKEQSEERKARDRAVAAADRAKASRDATAAAREVADLKKIQEQIAQALAKVKLQDSVQFTIDERGLVVTVVTNEVVFPGDRADLQPGGRKILDVVAPTLVKLPNNIQVDGHTNQLPVATRYYPSSWELSTARASVVVRYLTARGLPANRMTASGYADTRPLIDPKDPRSVNMNRRVDIVVLSTLPAEQRALLPAAARAHDRTN